DVGGQTATAVRRPVTTPREQRVVRDGTAALPDRAGLCFRQPLAYAPVTRGHLDCTVRLPSGPRGPPRIPADDADASLPAAHRLCPPFHHGTGGLWRRSRGPGRRTRRGAGD